jgi:hypothetical protein
LACLSEHTADRKVFRIWLGHFRRSGDLSFMVRTTIKPTTPTTTQKPAQLVVRSNVKAGHVWRNG